MLTLEKLAVYRAFEGDIDGWARSLRPEGTSNMTDDDWSVIEELRQGLFLVATGRASTAFSAALTERLFAVTADDPTRQALRELATNDRNAV
jgi:hypothetical protein